MARMAAALTILLVSAVQTWAADGPSMTTGQRTTQPIGHYDFCRKTPSECAKYGPIPARTPDDMMATVRTVNLRVNGDIKPRPDMEHHGVKEVWSYPDDGLGDCEDYALVKRRELMAKGIPAGNLLMTVADKPDGERHAVLTVRMESGDYVLDNLSHRVTRWDAVPYKFIKRQAETDEARWVDIIDGGKPTTDAVASASVPKP